MTLYGYWRSSAAWRVRIALHLKGLPFTNQPVNILAGEHRQPAHLARNPLGQLPVLDVGTPDAPRYLTQSMAILDWLEHAHPTPALFPADPWRRAQAIALAEIVNAGTHPVQNSTVLADVQALGGNRMAWACRAIERGLGALEAQSAATAGSYLVGDAITIADVCLVPQMFNARRYGVDLASMPRLQEIDARCAEHPAFAAAHANAQPDATVSSRHQES